MQTDCTVVPLFHITTGSCRNISLPWMMTLLSVEPQSMDHILLACTCSVYQLLHRYYYQPSPPSPSENHHTHQDQRSSCRALHTTIHFPKENKDEIFQKRWRIFVLPSKCYHSVIENSFTDFVHFLFTAACRSFCSFAL